MWGVCICVCLSAYLLTHHHSTTLTYPQTNRRLSLPAFHRPEILDRAGAVVVSLAKQMAEGWEASRRLAEQQEQGQQVCCFRC